MGWPFALGALLAWLWTEAPPSAATPTLEQLREETRQLAATHCGKCHASTSPKALGKALKVFDTERRDWTSALSDQQLPFVVERFKGLSPSDVPRVTAFIEAELAARKSRASVR